MNGKRKRKGRKSTHSKRKQRKSNHFKSRRSTVSTRRRKAFKPKLIEAMKKLKKLKGSRRVEEVARAPTQLIKDMSNALHTARQCKMKLPSGLIKKVKANANALRKMSNPRVSIKSKRKTIQQHGDGLVDTIANLIPTVGSILSGFLGL